MDAFSSIGLRGIPRGMTKTGKVTAKPAARTRFFLSIKRERKPPLQGANRPVRSRNANRSAGAPAANWERRHSARLAYMLSGAVTLNSSRPFSSTVRVAVHRYSRAACKASSLPFTRQAL